MYIVSHFGLILLCNSNNNNNNIYLKSNIQQFQWTIKRYTIYNNGNTIQIQSI